MKNYKVISDDDQKDCVRAKKCLRYNFSEDTEHTSIYTGGRKCVT